MRDDTVTKKKPKITIRTAARKFHCIGMPGVIARNTASSSDPTSTTTNGMSRSVRSRPLAPPVAPNSLTLSRKEATIVGSVRASVIRPAARTAPAPV